MVTGGSFNLTILKRWIPGIIFAVLLLSLVSYVNSAVITSKKDIDYIQYLYDNETGCRTCHGNVADRHHQLVANGTVNLTTNKSFQCFDCHKRAFDNQTQTNYTQIIRDCLICHYGTQLGYLNFFVPIKHTDPDVFNDIHHQLVKNGTINLTTNQPFGCMDCHTPTPGIGNGIAYTWDCTECHSTVRSILNVTPTPTPIPTPLPQAIIPGTPVIKLTTNRMTILDDPSGWDGGNATIPITNIGDQWSGESTTIRWYVLLLDSQGNAANNIAVSSQLLFPNGSVALVKTNLTNNSGIAAFDQDMDRWLVFNGRGSEGNYTINASATVNNTLLNGSYNFIYDEWGCGSSGSGCHKSQYWNPQGNDSQNASNFTNGSIQDSPYLHAWDNIHNTTKHHSLIRAGECLTCHRGYDGNPSRNHSSRVETPQYPAGIHAGKVPCSGCHASFGSGEMPIMQCYDCHPFKNANLTDVTNNNLTVRNFSQTATSGFSYQPLLNSSIMAHTPGNNIPCILCHDGMHNVSKPFNATGASNTFTEYQQCTVCHTLARHNDSVSCTVCHSQDAHAIKVLSQNATYIQGKANPLRGNCTNCHQNSSFLDALLSQPKAGAFAGESPQIPEPLHHSDNISNGSVWGSYWINTKPLTACIYCHSDTKHDSTPLGRILLWSPNYIMYSSIGINTSCANCHYKGNINYNLMKSAFASSQLPVPPEITNGINWNGISTNYFNHSFITYYDQDCKGCHGSLLSGSANMSEFLHNVATGAAGPNCILCHNLETGLSGGAPVGINFSAVNLSVHFGINSQNATSQSYVPVVGACWACHSSSGNVTSGHPDMYKTPKTCVDCHTANGTYYTQSVSWGLNVTVSEHYYGGDRIVAGNSSSGTSSCLNCHENVSEMIVYNNVTDNYGSFSGYGVGGNTSFFHYGRSRNDLRSWDSGSSDNCSYCHQNPSTAFNIAMVDPNYNASIANHSSNYNSTNPSCTNPACHNIGWIHNSTLNKPLSSDSLCKACHGADGIASKNNKSEHKNLYCTECHANSTNRTLAGKDIHPIKYLLQNNTFSTTNSSAVDCTTCHQSTSVDSSLGIFIPPKIMNPLHHSDNISNGSVWGSYWTNTKPLTACIYCHSDTTHDSTPLGRILLWSPNYTMYSSIGTNTSCANCHYKDNINYNLMSSTFASSQLPIPPEITNGNNWNGISTNYFNHSFITYYDQDCKGCHGSLLSGSANMSEFLHNVSVGGGGPDCALCHDINGIPSRTVDFSSFKKGVHSNLNSFAKNNTPIKDMADKACWACHGNGTEPPDGHPSNYKTPKNCNNNDCHSLSQSQYEEPMVYSHFQNASLNGNPNNGTNYNITAKAQCQFCHINSLVRTDTYPQLALASHYASKDSLIDSFNCTYCHRVKNNSEVWGNATLIYKNTTTLIELEKERNKLTAYEGESIYLGDGYFMKVVEISTERSEALIQLSKNNNIVDEFSLRVGVPYNYEEYITIDNGTFRTPIIILNMTSIFKGANKSLIQVSGFRTARVHAETNSTSCLACHLYRYSPEKERYLVIDRDVRDIPYHDIVYYTNVLVDFVSENKSKIYYNDDNYVLSQINTNFGRFLTSPTSQKYLGEGETWKLGENVSLKLNAVATDSKQALLSLMINNSVVEDWAVTSGSEFNYTRPIRYKGYEDTNVTIFSATLASIAQAKPNFVVLKDVVAISPSIRQTTANTTVFGFNTSWLFPNDTFIVGKVPENFHVPDLYTDQRTWTDCVTCHDTSSQLNIPDVNAISSRLGKHNTLNLNASSATVLSDSIDKACWACHTLDGEEPNAHIPTYVTPRDCKSCHVYEEKPSFGAINISDEPHALEQNCPACHIQNTHTLIRFEVSPVIDKISLSKTQVKRNETIHVAAEAIAGYKFKIRAAEYFIDGTGASGSGTPLEPVDGKFDSQMKEVTADINTSEIAPGKHILYIHAMERNNRWGEFSSINFTITGDPHSTEKTADLGIVVLIIGFIAAYLISRR